MKTGKHIRSACWCFLLAAAFVVSMVSHSDARPQKITSLALSDHCYSTANDASGRPATEIITQYANPKHSALRVKVKTKVFLQKTEEIPFSITTSTRFGISPDESYSGADDARPVYYNFLFRYTPF